MTECRPYALSVSSVLEVAQCSGDFAVSGFDFIGVADVIQQPQQLFCKAGRCLSEP
jgi:hypothetical protein